MPLSNPTSSATLNSVVGLRQALSGSGYSVVTSRGIWPYDGLSGTSQTQVTYQQLVVFPTSCTNVRMVWVNAYDADLSGPNAITITASIVFVNSSGYISNGVQSLMFNGEPSTIIYPGGRVVSDPSGYAINAGQVAYIRTCVTVSTGQQWPVGYFGVNGIGGMGESIVNGSDATKSTSGVFGSISYSPQYGVCAVLGQPSTNIASVAITGDSIITGTGYYVNDISFATIALNGQSNVQTTAIIPWVRISNPGETLGTATSYPFGKNRRFLLSGCNYCLCNYGTNDIYSSGATLSTMQTNTLAFVASNMALGIKTYWCTLSPRTTSTDGFISIANQTLGAYESVRTGFNDWLRSTSGTGFAAQSGGWGGVFDTAAKVEVNSSNVPTLDGGYWLVNPSAATSGTTSASTSATISVSGSPWTANQFQGNSIFMTSGPAAGEFREVASNTTNLINVTSGNFSPVPTAGGGDSFTIYKTYSIDGTHPTTLGHNLMATAINTALMVPR